MRSVKIIYPSSSIKIQNTFEKQKNYQTDAIAVRLARSATFLLVIVCFLVLPIFWLQVMIRFSTIHLIHLQKQQQIREQNYLNENICKEKENKCDDNIIFATTYDNSQNKGNYPKYELDPWAKPMKL